MTPPSNLLDPPEKKTAAGDLRRVGVELEFSGLDVEAAAGIVQGVYGGEIHQISDHRYEVDTPDFSVFTIELDTKYAHPNPTLAENFGSDSLLAEADRSISKTVGDISSGLVPTEIVTPPLPYNQLHTLTAVLDGLRDKSAKGTDSSVLAGFGLHLNPEAASTEAEHIVRMLKAYLICSPKLRDFIQVDATRRLLPHVDPFPEHYIQRVLDPSYGPEQANLIDDYLGDNPTRNRELDLLPLFKHVDENRIVAALNDDRIKARPAYDYRLPDMNLSNDDWSVVT